MPSVPSPTGATAVIAAICTYRRNEALERLLDGLLVVAGRSDDYALGVVVVDDTAERLAEPVVQRYVGRFERGIEYCVAGRQNISIARNIALDAAVPMGDWIVMTDDDCVPDPGWIVEMLAVQRRTGADAVTGPEVRRAPPDAPQWLIAQPFLELGLHHLPDREVMSVASTHNSMVSASWLREHPLRFAPELGRLGGEDMVFFKEASRQGLRIRHAANAVVYEDQPAERCTFRYVLRNALWLGNSQFVTSVDGATASRTRMIVHGTTELARAAVRPLTRLATLRPPQVRFAAASAVRAIGILAGTVGVRIAHH